MIKPLVSIIINNYNYGRFLAYAVNSAIEQTYPNREIIIVDDGSTDNSREIITGLPSGTRKLFKENGGQASALNAGIKASSGEIILFLDADDLLHAETVETVVNKVADKKFAKAHWQLVIIDSEGNRKEKLLPDKSLAEGDYLENVIRNGPADCGGPPNSPPMSGNAWSRGFLNEIFPLPEKEFRQTADFYLMALAPVYGTIIKIEEPLGFYRVHGTNSTLRKDYREEYILRFEHVCKGLGSYLHVKGFNADPDNWPRTHWFHEVDKALKEIAKAIPPGSQFLLADESNFATPDYVAGSKRYQYMNRDGYFGGHPENDGEAIDEIENYISMGVSIFVMGWTCFWYLEHYKKFAEYLRTNFRLTVNNDRLKIYLHKDSKL